jgi:hypothetical protein
MKIGENDLQCGKTGVNATLEFRLRSASVFGVNTQIVSLERTRSHRYPLYLPKTLFPVTAQFPDFASLGSR